MRDLNSQPSALEADALPIELMPHFSYRYRIIIVYKRFTTENRFIQEIEKINEDNVSSQNAKILENTN